MEVSYWMWLLKVRDKYVIISVNVDTRECLLDTAGLHTFAKDKTWACLTHHGWDQYHSGDDHRSWQSHSWWKHHDRSVVLRYTGISRGNYCAYIICDHLSHRSNWKHNVDIYSSKEQNNEKYSQYFCSKLISWWSVIITLFCAVFIHLLHTYLVAVWRRNM